MLLVVAGFLGWFAALVHGAHAGRAARPRRRSDPLPAQTNAYLLLVTDRYPYAVPRSRAAGARAGAGARARSPGPAEPSPDAGLKRARFRARSPAWPVVWIVAAVLLWRSAVPDGLTLPHVDVDATSRRELVARAERYERFLRFDSSLSQVVLLVVLSLYARHGARFTRESAAGRIGTGMLLGMLGLGTRLALAAAVRARRGVVAAPPRPDASRVRRVARSATGSSSALRSSSSASRSLIVMALAGSLRERWWIGAAPAFVALAALFAFVSPYLVRPSASGRPASSCRRPAYAREQGVDADPRRGGGRVGDTTTPNAYAAGLRPDQAGRHLGHAARRPLRGRRGARRARARDRAPLEQAHARRGSPGTRCSRFRARG